MAFYSGSIAKDCYCYYLRHLIVSENEENVILIDFSCFHELPVICQIRAITILTAAAVCGGVVVQVVVAPK